MKTFQTLSFRSQRGGAATKYVCALQTFRALGAKRTPSSLRLRSLFSVLHSKKRNTEDTKNHREPQRNQPFCLPPALIFFSMGPQCSLWPFSVSSVLNSEKREENVRALQAFRRLVIQSKHENVERAQPQSSSLPIQPASVSLLYSVFFVLKPFACCPEKSRANPGFILAGRSSAARNALHCFGEAANSRLSARTRSACKQALSRMKSVTLTPVVSAPVRISSSWRSVARRLMRRVRIVLAREVAIASPRFRDVRTLYVTGVWMSTRGPCLAARSFTAILEPV
jgi:hypothetical protein